MRQHLTEKGYIMSGLEAISQTTQGWANILLDGSGNVDQTRFFIFLGTTAVSIFVISRLFGPKQSQPQPQISLFDRHLHIPESIKNREDIESVYVRKFNILPKDETAKDYFSINKDDQLTFLRGVMFVRDLLERESPAAGYKVRFIGSNSGNNPMEIEISAFGHRELGSKMQMSEKDPFCKHVIPNDKKLEKFPELSDAKFRVIETLQGNGQVISEIHADTWFDLSIEDQWEMLDRAGKLLQKFKKAQEDKLNYEIVIHNGLEGHQNVGHVHAHLLVGTSQLLAKV